MRRRYQRTLLSSRIHRVAHAQRTHALHERLAKPFVHLALHQHATSTQTNLPLILEPSPHRARHRRVKVRISKHDRWVLATQF